MALETGRRVRAPRPDVAGSLEEGSASGQPSGSGCGHPEVSRAGAHAPASAHAGPRASARSTGQATLLAGLDALGPEVLASVDGDVVLVLDARGAAPHVTVGDRPKTARALVHAGLLGRRDGARHLLRHPAPRGFAWVVALLPEATHALLVSTDGAPDAR